MLGFILLVILEPRNMRVIIVKVKLARGCSSTICYRGFFGRAPTFTVIIDPSTKGICVRSHTPMGLNPILLLESVHSFPRSLYSFHLYLTLGRCYEPSHNIMPVTL